MFIRFGIGTLSTYRQSEDFPGYYISAFLRLTATHKEAHLDRPVLTHVFVNEQSSWLLYHKNK